MYRKNMDDSKTISYLELKKQDGVKALTKCQKGQRGLQH
jgi:hypothetical protein